MLRGKRQTYRQTAAERQRRERQEETKINAEMLLQKLSPPNHVIPLYRGDAEALLDQVSHSSPRRLRGAAGVWEGNSLWEFLFPHSSNLKLDCLRPNIWIFL